MNARADSLRGIQRDVVLHARRKALGQLIHARAHGFGCLHGVRSRQLVDGHHACGIAVQSCVEAINLLAQLDACDVAQVQHRAIRVGAQDDAAELRRINKSALGLHGVGELLPTGHRLAADLSGRVHIVLRADRVDDVGGRDAELRHLRRVDPNAESVLSAENLHATDPGDARQLILHVDDAVVGEERAIVAPVGRVQADNHQWRCERLLHREPNSVDLRGKLRLRLGDAQL
jgi:hypothetical protein